MLDGGGGGVAGGGVAGGGAAAAAPGSEASTSTPSDHQPSASAGPSTCHTRGSKRSARCVERRASAWRNASSKSRWRLSAQPQRQQRQPAPQLPRAAAALLHLHRRVAPSQQLLVPLVVARARRLRRGRRRGRRHGLRAALGPRRGGTSRRQPHWPLPPRAHAGSAATASPATAAPATAPLATGSPARRPPRRPAARAPAPARARARRVTTAAASRRRAAVGPRVGGIRQPAEANGEAAQLGAAPPRVGIDKGGAPVGVSGAKRELVERERERKAVAREPLVLVQHVDALQRHRHVLHQQRREALDVRVDGRLGCRGGGAGGGGSGGRRRRQHRVGGRAGSCGSASTLSTRPSTRICTGSVRACQGTRTRIRAAKPERTRSGR